jgi:DNA-binding LacI/PurR family transcriptional regulator
LTTVRQGIQTQGVYAGRTLFDLLNHPDDGPRRIVLPTELIIRRSTVGGSSHP